MIKIQALKYDWKNYSCYFGLITYHDIPILIKSEVDQSMNRDIDMERVNDIIQYLRSNSTSSFFPPIILNSSNKVDYDSTNRVLKANNKDFTIIDGQHRIKAITEIFGKTEYTDLKNIINDLNIPFLLIESLEPELHRDLFRTINDNAANVESTVSERFTTNLRNMIGLKYISENPAIKPLIEWEDKQSSDKIVYKHLTRCIDEMIISLNQVTLIDISNQLIYKDDDYYHFYKLYWDSIFNFIQISDSKSFWVRFVTLYAVTKFIFKKVASDPSLVGLANLNEVKEQINTRINESIGRYFLPKLVFDYKGKMRQNDSTYDAIIKYLETNLKLITEEGINVDLISENTKIKYIINKYLMDNHFKGEYYTFENYDSLKSFIQTVIINIDRINSLEEKNITTIKQISSIEDII